MLIAQTVFISAKIADSIFHEGARLPEFRIEITGILLLMLLLVLLPLTFFMLKLSKARRTGRREYGILTTHYANDFRKKWIRTNKENEKEPLLGTADIQSLADLGNRWGNEPGAFYVKIRFETRLSYSTAPFPSDAHDDPVGRKHRPDIEDAV
jgi:hypothetical protein